MRTDNSMKTLQSLKSNDYDYDHSIPDLNTFFKEYEETVRVNKNRKMSQFRTHIYLRKWKGGREQKPIGKTHLIKEMKSLRKKLFKKDRSIYLEYAIEKNYKSNTYLYHVHLIVHHSSFENLEKVTKKYIKHFTDDFVAYRNVNGNKFARVNGNYGYIDYINIYDYNGIRDYLDKTLQGVHVA